MRSLKGKLLISAGSLFDPNFRHTVVLLGEHDANGAVGVVLNRRLDATVAATVPLLAGLVPPGETLFEGGPVAPDQVALLAEVARPGLLDVPVLGSVGFLTGDVPAAVRPDVLRARVFLGHAGWGPGQLEGELEEGSWVVEPAVPDDAFTPEPGSLWRRVLERKGPRYAMLARVPFDPSTN